MTQLKTGPVKTSPASRIPRRRVRTVLLELSRLYPNVSCGLIYHNPTELLVAVILSAQCTDVRVNLVTPRLFARYPDFAALASASQSGLEEIIKSTGFFRHKAANILALSRIMHQAGPRAEIPRSLEELVKLPGVGRKTANVVLGELYGRPGLVVDTHVKRLSRHLGLSKSQDAEKIERDLMPLVPKPCWNLFSHLLIQHGRSLCPARSPDCLACPLCRHCPTGRKRRKNEG